MKNLILLIALYVPGIAIAQSAASDKAVAEACKCYEALEKKKLTEDEKKAGSMECLTKSMLANIGDLAKEYGYDTAEFNEETGRKIGEKFGMKLVQKCPAAIPYMMMLSEGQAQTVTVGSGAAYESTGETSGTFVRVESGGEVVKIVIKTDDGDETFRWIRPFPGAEKLEQQAKTLAGKKVSVEWGEYQQYVHAMKGYAKYREITAFKISG